MRPMFAFTVLLALTGFARAQLTAPPLFKLVASTDKDKGELVCKYTIRTMMAVQKQVVEIVNGQQVAKIVPGIVETIEMRTTVFELAKCRVITPDGKQLAIDEAIKRLKADEAVAIAADSNPPAAVFLRALNPQTLLIIPPQAPASVVPVPVPIPAPKKVP